MLSAVPPEIIVGRTQSTYSQSGVQNQELSITYTVYNEQTSAATGVLLSTTLEPGVTVKSSSLLPDQTGSELAWSLGTIPALGRAAVTLTVELPATLPNVIDGGAEAFATINGAFFTNDTPAVTLSNLFFFLDEIASTPDANTTDPFIQEKAAELRYDPQAIFDYIQTEIDYNSYVGSVRGSRGTLWSSAGNSLDVASLGVALMRASGYPAEYLSGTLTTLQAQSLIASMFPNNSQTVGYVPTGSPTVDPLNDPQLLAETQNHYWFRFDAGAGWVDADPLIAGAMLGQSFTTSTSTFSEVADSLREKTEIKLTVETFTQISASFGVGDGLSQSVVLQQTFNDVDLVGRPITLGTIVDVTSQGLVIAAQTTTYTPYIQLSDIAFPGVTQQETISGTQYQDVRSNLAILNSVVTGVFLDITQRGPQGASVTYNRILADRIGYATRQGFGGGQVTIDPDAPPIMSPFDVFTLHIEPGQTDPDYPGTLAVQADAMVVQLNSVVTNFEANPDSLAAQAPVIPSYIEAATGITQILGPGFFALSEARTQRIAAQSLVTTYSDRPRIVMISQKLIETPDASLTNRLSIDLIRDSVRALAYPGQSISAVRAFQAVRGVSESFAEGDSLNDQLGLSGSEVQINTPVVFKAAIAQGIPLVTLTAANLGQLDGLDISDLAKARITFAIQNGSSVIVPAQSPIINGNSVISWYEILPSGEAIGVSEDGGHNATFLEALAGWAFGIGVIVSSGVFLVSLFYPNAITDLQAFVNKTNTDFNNWLSSIRTKYRLNSLPLGLLEIQNSLTNATVGETSGLTQLGSVFTSQLAAAIGVPLSTTPLANPLSSPNPPPPFGLNQPSTDNPITATRTGGAVNVNMQTNSVTVRNQLTANWAATSSTSFAAASLSSASATVRNSSGVVVGTGAVSLSSAANVPVSVSGNLSYNVTGFGSLTAYDPVASNLGVSADWQNYTATVSGTADLTLTASGLQVNGVTLPADTYTITASGATLSGSGLSTSANYTGTLTIQATSGTVYVGAGTGTATVGGSAVTPGDGFTLGGFNGTATITAGGSNETVTLTGTSANILTLSGGTPTLSTDQNTPATFQINVSTSLADTYHIALDAPPGWIASISSTGLVTLTSPPGVQSGTYPIRFHANSTLQPDIISDNRVMVTVTPTTPGIVVSVDPDPSVPVPFQGAEVPTSFGTSIRNLGPAEDSYDLTISNVPAGFEILTSGDSVTIPAGTTGLLGVYARPSGSTLPAPGTPLSFMVTVTSQSNPTITDTITVNFTMPEVNGVSMVSTPSATSLLPGGTAPGSLVITNIGNVATMVSLAQSLTAGLNVTGLPGTLNLAVGQTVMIPLTYSTPSTTTLNSNLAATFTATFGAGIPTNPQRVQVPVRVVVPGADALANAATTAQQLGNVDLAARLKDLSTALTNLVVNPSSPVFKSQSLATLDAIIRMIGADELLTSVFGDLTSARAQLAAAATLAQIQAAAVTLGNTLGNLSTVLTNKLNHGFSLSLVPNSAVAQPGGASTYNVAVTNMGTQTTTYDLTVLGLPGSVNAVFNQTSVTLAPGETSLGGANAVTLSLSQTGSLFPTEFTVHAVAQPATELALEAIGTLTMRPEFVSVASVTATPSFSSTGTTVDVSAKILNAVNMPQSAKAFYTVENSSGVTVFSSTEVIFSLSVQTSLANVNLGSFDASAYLSGEYTINVTVTDSSSTPIPCGTGSGRFLLGTPVSATISVSPSTVPQGDSTVTNTLTVISQQTFPAPLTLVGQVLTEPDATTITVMGGSIAYVGGTNGIDIVDISDPTNPTVVDTFAESLIVQGGFNVVRRLGTDKLVIGATTNINATGFTLLIYSITDPLNPTLISNTDIDFAFISSLQVVGNTLLVSTNGYEFNTFVVSQFGDVVTIDVSDPTNPMIVDSLENTGQPFSGTTFKADSVLVNATTAYVASTTSTGSAADVGIGRVLVTDISDPTDLSVLNEVQIPGTVHVVAVGIQGSRALVVGSTGGLQNPLSSTTAGYTGNLTLTLLDITDPLNPTIIGNTLVTPGTFPRGFIIAKLSVLSLGNGNFAVSEALVDGNPVLLLVNPSDPNNIAAAAFSVNSLVNEMAVSGGQLYTTSADGLAIYDMGALTLEPAVISVQVPNSAGDAIVPGSFNFPPDQIIPGAGFDTLVWNRTFAFGMTSTTFTWQSTVNDLTAGEVRDVTLGTTVNFTSMGTPGTITLPPTSVDAAQIIGLTPATQSITPGGSADFTVTLTNPTSSGVTYSLSVDGVPPGWVNLPSNVLVFENFPVEVTLTLTTDLFTNPTDYDFTVVAQGTNGSLGSVQGTLTVAGSPPPVDTQSHGVVVTITPTSATAGPLTRAEYTVRITNTGSSTEEFTLSDDTFALSSLFDQFSVVVPPGASNYREVHLSLEPQVGMTPGPRAFNVFATSTTSSATGSAAATLVVAANGVLVTLNNQTGSPGDTFLATIQNTGSVTDTFDLALAGPAGLGATLGITSVTLAPGQSTVVPVVAGSLSYLVQGETLLSVRANSRTNPAVESAATAFLTITPTTGLSSNFDPATKVIPVPGTGDFILFVENTGNSEQAYTATISGTNGPVTASIVGLDGRATSTVPIFRLPGLTTGVFVLSTNLMSVGEATVTVDVQTLTGPSLTTRSVARIATPTSVTPTPPPPPAPPKVPRVRVPDPQPPQPAMAAGRTDGTAVVLVPTAGKYVIGQTLDFFPGFNGVVRVATADVTGDGVADYIGGAGPGGLPRVVVIDGASGNRIADFIAYELSYTGGVFVAAGDIDGDGKAEVVVSPDRGGGPVIAVYSGAKLTAAQGADAQMIRYFGIDDPAFRGGARVAVGDINGDGFGDVVVAAGFQGGPRVAGFSGKFLIEGQLNTLFEDFFVFEEQLRDGAYVAAGDVDGDGFADLAFGGGPSGGPRIRLVNGKILTNSPDKQYLDEIAAESPDFEKANFFAGDPNLRGGVHVALRDVDGDGYYDLVSGSGDGEASLVRVYRSATLFGSGISDQDIDPLMEVIPSGVFVG